MTEIKFLLKSINASDILALYKDVKKNGRKFVKHAKIKPSDSDVKYTTTYTSDQEKGVHAVDTKTNTNIFATTSHRNYKIFSGKNHLRNCMVCFKELEASEGGGYPIKYSENTVMSPEGRRSLNYVLWCEGSFCTLNCALLHLERNRKGVESARDGHKVDSIRILKFLHRLMHPDADDLRPANDPMLLKRFGGSLDYEEWSKGDSYDRTNGVILVPAKVQYLKT